jgi:cytidyltransferase-like protein
MIIVLATGGFDPIHSGHISYLKAAKTLGDMLIVGLNSDEWLERKKGRAFMPWNERLCVLNNLQMVDEVYTFDDSDGTANHFIQQVRAHYPTNRIIFTNGGDRTIENTPEVNNDVEFVFGIGGTNKKNSSSVILSNWKNSFTERPWGDYSVLYENQGTKVKEITLLPKQSLSLQRHKNRNEFWLVAEGQCDVKGMLPNGYPFPTKILKKHDKHDILTNEWHQLSNPYDEPCKLIEIQYGKECVESDIERM